MRAWAPEGLHQLFTDTFFAGMGLKPGRKIVPFLLKKKPPANNFLSKKTNEVSGSKSRPLYRMTPLYLTVSKKYEKEKTFLSFLLLGADSTMTSQLVNLIYKRFHFILGIHRVRAQSETRLSST